MPGEIAGDELAEEIARIARDPALRTILEVGSATGEGSTRAFVDGIEENPSRPTLFCIESVKERCAELQARYADRPYVRPYNVSSVPVESFASEEEVRGFYRIISTALNRFPIELVLSWRAGDIEYVTRTGIPQDGIELVKRENGIDVFDAVLLDGSEFTARAELDLVAGARFVLLDDVNTFKNHHNAQRLLADARYRLRAGNPQLRFGYAVFERIR